MARVVTGPTDSQGRYTWYCRICGNYSTSIAVPVRCAECGNIEGDEGFGCSGDPSEDTTVTVNKVQGGSYTRVGVIDKPRRH